MLVIYSKTTQKRNSDDELGGVARATTVQRIYSDCEFTKIMLRLCNRWWFLLFHVIYTKHRETPDVEYDSKIQANFHKQISQK